MLSTQKVTPKMVDTQNNNGRVVSQKEYRWVKVSTK